VIDVEAVSREQFAHRLRGVVFIVDNEDGSVLHDDSFWASAILLTLGKERTRFVA
jgi:hypothetical protein